jgi:hypothetical protein
MQSALARSARRSTSVLRTWWLHHGATVLRLSRALLTAISFVWLAYQFWRLVSGGAPIWPTSPVGAIDLRLRYTETHNWFARQPVYTTFTTAVYPPATYAMLWPVLGWLEYAPARWLWAATTLVALAWLVHLAVRESEVETRSERALLALVLLSTYAVGATIGNGQLGVHVLAALLTGLLLLRDRRYGWLGDLLGVVLILMALAKPSLTAPFFWLVLVLPRKRWPAVLLATVYVGLTLYAASFQEASLASLLSDWLARGSEVALVAGQAHVHAWLSSIGLGAWILPVSLFMVILLGAWTFYSRSVDFWLLAGVAALVARLWVYHLWYDDLLLVTPMLSLFRIARRGPSDRGTDVVAGVLLALTVLAMLAPGGLYLFPTPWKQVYIAGQTVTWLAILVFLLVQAERERRSRSIARSVRRRDSLMSAR